MFIKIVFLLLISGTILASGCIAPNDIQASVENVSDTGTANRINISEKDTIQLQNISSLNNESLVLERSGYDTGEQVRARFTFSGELYVHPLMQISRYYNETWNFLGMWTFDGAQYVCCGAIPSCIKSNSSPESPIDIVWDQKIVSQTLPVISEENITYQQADPGLYQIRVVYGKDRVCSDSIDAEFSINGTD